MTRGTALSTSIMSLLALERVKALYLYNESFLKILIATLIAPASMAASMAVRIYFLKLQNLCLPSAFFSGLRCCKFVE
jgi:hypothetical protein